MLHKTFRHDLQAALAITLLGIPQAIAYAMIAGLPPVVGLYASALPAVVGSATRSSSHVVSGPTNALSLLVGGFMATQTLDMPPVTIAVTLAFLVGLMQLSAGVLRLGALVDYISRAVVLGYITGAGVLIGVGQLGNLTGTPMGSGGPVARVVNWLGTLGGIHVATLLVGVGTVLLLVGLRVWAPRAPGAVIAMVLGIALSRLLGLEASGVATIRTLAPITAGLPPITLPRLDPGLIDTLWPVAFAAAMLSLVEASSVGRALAGRTGERLDMSREFAGQGLANIAAGFTGGYPTSGSLTRSVLNQSLGAKSRWSGIFSGLMIVVVLVALGPLVNDTPVASLAGLLMVVAWDLVDVSAIRHVLRARMTDRLAFLATCIGTWTLSLDKAIYLGVVISLVLFVRRASMLDVRELVIRRGKVREVEADGPGQLSRHVRAMHVEGSLFFGAANALSDAIDEATRDPEVTVLVLRVKRAQGLDYTAAGVLIAARQRLEAEGRHLLLVGMKPHMMETLRRVGLTDAFPDEALFPTEKEWFVAMDRALVYAASLVEELGADEEVRAYLAERRPRLHA